MVGTIEKALTEALEQIATRRPPPMEVLNLAKNVAEEIEKEIERRIAANEDRLSRTGNISRP